LNLFPIDGLLGSWASHSGPVAATRFGPWASHSGPVADREVEQCRMGHHSIAATGKLINTCAITLESGSVHQKRTRLRGAVPPHRLSLDSIQHIRSGHVAASSWFP